MLPIERHLQGREHMAACLNWWLGRCNITHTQSTALAGWVCGDSTWLQGSQLSHLRNARMRAPQLKLMEGLAALNEAMATWLLVGKAACIQRWGPLPSDAPAAMLMDAATYLWHPEQPEGTVPLVFHDFCDLFVGRLRLPYVVDVALSPRQARILSDRIGEELDRWLTAQGGIRKALATLIHHYPVDDAVRVAKLQQVILGTDSYSAEELDREMYALSELFAALWQRPLTPLQLRMELEAARPGDPAENGSGDGR